MRCLKTLCVGAVIGAASLLAGAAHAEGWDPYYQDDLYIRNNSLSTFTVSITNTKRQTGCAAGEDISYPEGTSATLEPASMKRILDTNASWCGGSGTAWKITLQQSGVGTSVTMYFSAGSFYSGSYASTEGAASQAIGNETVTFYSRKSLHLTGSYITIGDDYFGKLGPSQTTEYSETLTVTSYNAHVGDQAAAEVCERGKIYQTVLASLKTDVLLLQEMNYSGDECSSDAHELISYLWTGTADNSFENSGYASGDSGVGTSPKGAGVFPYISQMVEGYSSGGNEENTGGDIILSKYPVQMIYNEKFSGSGAVGYGQKGFIIAKITKNLKDYYIVNTHLSADDNDARIVQYAQIEEKLNTLPAGSRVILGGDLNSAVHADAKDSNYANNHFWVYDSAKYGGSSGGTVMAEQTNTGYYRYSRDGRKNFYGTLSDVKNIDWAIPIGTLPNGTAYFTWPKSYSWWVHPVRYVKFAFGDLSDHFAVSAKIIFAYRSFGGTTVGSVTEDATTPAKGTITVSDKTPIAVQSETPGKNGYGTYNVTWSSAGGSWTYTLNSNHSAVQALGAGKTLTDSFTVYTIDGESSTDVTITIKGANDAAVISGTKAGTVTEDIATSVQGTLTVADVDSGQASFQKKAVNGTYGSFLMDTVGSWSYGLRSSDLAVKNLLPGQTLQDSYTVASYDGTTAQVTITIKGVNDAAVITGTQAGTVTEDGTTKVTGTLYITDEEPGQASFRASTSGSGTVLNPVYGTFSINTVGAWTYELNNSHSKVQALSEGQSLSEVHYVYSYDGTQARVTITINGSNKGQTITGTPGNDTLTGGNENDTINGLAGSDTMTGGSGDDLYYVDTHNGDVVIEAANGGSDLVKSEVIFRLGSNVEHLTLSGTRNVDGYGNELDNTITGNSGLNILVGYGGNDTLIDGGGDSDEMYGGSGNDAYYVSSVTADVVEGDGEGTDTVISSVHYTLKSTSENLTLSGSNNTNATGNNVANIIKGSKGNNTLTGGGGTDTFYFTGGKDVIADFSVGEKIYIQLASIDLASEIAVSGYVYTFTGYGSTTTSLTISGADPSKIKYDTATGALVFYP